MSTIVSDCMMPLADGVGTIGVTVFDEDGVQLIARSTVGVVRVYEGADYGHYIKKLTIGDAETRVVCIWDDGAGNAACRVYDIPFTDAQRQALRDWAVNPDAKSIDDLTTPKNVVFDV